VGIRHALIGGAIGLLVAAGARSARADVTNGPATSARPVTLTIATDEAALAALGISVERLMYHTRIEANAVIVPPAASDSAELHAFVDPGTDGLSVALTLEDRAHARTDSRVILLTDVGLPDRARVVALGLAELVRAFAPRRQVREGPHAPAPPALPSPVPAVEVPQLGPAELPATVALDASVGAIAFPMHGAWLVDPRIGAERRLAGALWARADLGVWLGGADDTLGNARLVVPTLDLGVMWRVEPNKVFTLGAGPMLGVGVAFASADAIGSSRATAESALTMQVLLGADLRVRVLGPLALTAGASAGVMLRGAEVRADDRVLLAATGLCVAGRAGVVLLLP
jgi:hypothetical protein